MDGVERSKTPIYAVSDHRFHYTDTLGRLKWAADMTYNIGYFKQGITGYLEEKIDQLQWFASDVG